MAETKATLHLVACVSGKANSRLPAKDLYTSDWFRKARAYVEQRGGRWFVLSAKHGLVDPNVAIAPYEVTLLRMKRHERRAWSGRVLAALEPHLAHAPRVVFLAGQRYREDLAPALAARGLRVEVPMAGLQIGKQLAWLKKRVAAT